MYKIMETTAPKRNVSIIFIFVNFILLRIFLNLLMFNVPCRSVINHYEVVASRKCQSKMSIN